MQPKLNLLTPVLLLALGAGCHKNVQSIDGDAAPSSASASAAASFAVAAAAPADDADAGTEIAPPEAVVAQDPNIPVNEAVVGTAPIAPDYTASFAPPAQPVVEDQPARPEADDTWVPGYWWWSRPLNKYVWVGGAWRHPPPDQTWTPGRWTPVGGRFVWTPGYWAPRGQVREVIDVAPPVPRVEVRPAAPGADFVWTPGYYAWHGGRYEWTAGNWVRPPRVGVAWVEPRYVVSGGHWYLQPGRWDFAPEHRGVVYRPEIDVRPGVRLKLEPVAPTVIVQHANFVAVSSRAVARGAVRTERGGFVVPRAEVTEVVRPEERAHVVMEAPRVEVRERVEAPRIDVREHVEGPRVDVRERVEAPRVDVREHVVEPRREEVRVNVTPQPPPQQRVRVDVRAPAREVRRR